MQKERNKADGYREKAYEGDTKAMNNLGVCYERGTGVPKDERKGLKWIHKATFQGFSGIPARHRLLQGTWI